MLAGLDRVPPDGRTDSSPEGALELHGVQRTVWEALQQVSAGARDALILRYYEELPYAEIGEILGCTADAARARVAHGKTQLRSLLGEPEEERTRQSSIVRAKKAGVG